MNKLFIAQTLTKNAKGVIKSSTGFIELKLIKANIDEDWAILKRTDKNVFDSFGTISLDKSRLPPESVTKQNLFTRYYNSGMFESKLICLFRHCALKMYQKSKLLGDAYGECEVQVEGGGLSGNCGSPYYLPRSNDIFGFHVASDNEGSELDLSNIEGSVKSLSTVYVHYSFARIFCRLPGFVATFTELQTEELAGHQLSSSLTACSSSTTVVPTPRNIRASKRKRGIM